MMTRCLRAAACNENSLEWLPDALHRAAIPGKTQPMQLRSFDPRARILFYIAVSTGIGLMTDLRVLVPCFVLGLQIFLWGRLDAVLVRKLLPTLVIFTTVLFAVNYFGGGLNAAIAQALRGLAIAGVSFGMLLSLNLNDIGLAFKQMGFPDKFAYAIELMARFVPTLVRDFRTTIDAQKARGYELEARERSIKSYFNAGYRFLPMIVPVVVRAVVDSEDTANALDLRAFGTRKRTWLRQFSLTLKDWLMIGTGALLLAGALAWRAWIV